MLTWRSSGMTDEYMNDHELRVTLARLDERLKALVQDMARSERDSERRIKDAAEELARRLDILNHAHQEAIRVQGTYVPREMWERDKKESDAKIIRMDNESQNLQGRLWVYMIAVPAVVAAVAAAVIRMVFR